jgi:hypothetical protein
MRAFLLSLMVLAAPRVAAAQPRQAAPSAPSPRRWQVSAGYTFMRESDITDKIDFPAGWFVGAAARVNCWLSVVGDVDGQYKTIPFVGNDTHLTSHAVTGGLRASARLGRFVEFGQVLGGIVQSTGTAFGTTETTTHATVQPGLGLDYQLGGKWAIRGELDVRFISTGQEIRVATGIVHAFR